MRVVIASAGPRSEVYPMLALAGELARRGHIVTLCVPEKYRSKLMTLEHRMVTCGASFDEFLDGPRTGDVQMFVRALASQIPAQFVAMRDSLREADILVYGGFMLAAPSQAELQKLPAFSAIQTPLLLNADQFPAAGMPLKKGIFDSTRGRRKEWEFILLPAINREREFSHLPKISNLHQYFYRGGHVLAAHDPSVVPVSASASETVTGFWQFDDSGFSSGELVPFLAEGPAPVLISPLALPKEQAASFLEELCAHLSSHGIRAVVHSEFTDAHKAKIPENCRVLDAFPTERFSAVLHSGAPQQFSAAAHAALPQVTIPVLAEHGFWSEKIGSLGLGPGAVSGFDAARVSTAIREAISGDPWKERCRQYAERLKEQNGPAVAAETIERFGVEAGHGS